MIKSFSHPVGIYEKAFPAELPWEARLDLAAQAGYDFVEMSIDESESRLERLSWPASERSALRQAIYKTGTSIFTIGLSAHRKFPLGSRTAETRQQGLDILFKTIELASDIGARIIQLMGYDVFYEPSDANTQARFLEGLRWGVHWAEMAGVMLAIENVDVKFVDSVEKAMRFVREVGSPWFNTYPDLGNMVASGYNPVSQLPLAQGCLVGVHVKDTLPGVFRGVPFGTGDVPFSHAFKTLAEMDFWGPIAIEMWAHLDPTGDSLTSATKARQFVDSLIKAAWN